MEPITRNKWPCKWEKRLRIQESNLSLLQAIIFIQVVLPVNGIHYGNILLKIFIQIFPFSGIGILYWVIMIIRATLVHRQNILLSAGAGECRHGIILKKSRSMEIPLNRY